MKTKILRYMDILKYKILKYIGIMISFPCWLNVSLYTLFGTEINMSNYFACMSIVAMFLYVLEDGK